ncbi:MAG: hypothetical protein WD276_05205 [Actinomycetota bacterium]
MAIAVAGATNCGALAWISPRKIEPLENSVEAAWGPWMLGEALRRAGGDCSDLGQAESPAWSPDGDLIAFFASPESAEFDFLDRGSAPFNLYFLTPPDGHPQLVLPRVTGISNTVWSPNGEWVAFSGDINGRGVGTWVISRETRRLVRVSATALKSITWSEDGATIAGLRSEAPAGVRARASIILLDVTSLQDTELVPPSR